MNYLSQKDPKWGNMKLGTSNVTIGTHGCTITSIAMILGATPIEVNKRLLEVKGYLNGNLVIWDKIKEAFPDRVESVRRVWNYDNADILNNVPVIVQVDGAPIGGDIHFVVYKGNKELVDPWTGTVRPTSTYSPQSYCVIKTKHIPTQPEIPQPNDEFKKLQASKYANGVWYQAQDVIKYIEDRIQETKEKENALLVKDKVIGDKEKLIQNLNQQVNDRNNDIAKLNAEINTLRKQVNEAETQRDMAEDLAKQLPSLKEQIQHLEESRDGYYLKEEQYIKRIKELENKSIPQNASLLSVYNLIMSLDRQLNHGK